MSHSRDLSTFDFLVIILLVAGLGALAHLSRAPSNPSTPGARWSGDAMKAHSEAPAEASQEGFDTKNLSSEAAQELQESVEDIEAIEDSESNVQAPTEQESGN